MNGDRAAEMAFLLLALTLPVSALIARRLPIGETARMAALWFVIIVGTVFLVTIAQGGIARVKAWLRPAEPDGPARVEMVDIDPTHHLILHNIYYRDGGVRRHG